MGRRLILHPLLAAVFPLLFLIQHNRDQPVPVPELTLVFTGAIAFVLVAWLVARAVLGDTARAALVASFTGILALSYGHYALAANEVLRVAGAGYLPLGSAVFLIPWLVVLAIGAWVLGTRIRDVTMVNTFANAVGVALVLVALTGSALGGGGVEVPPFPDEQEVNAVLEDAAPPFKRLPNIYYIVLDEYAHPRVLEEELGHDPDPFLDGLRENDLHVVDRSRANYPMTFLSLASTLNMRYLDHVREATDDEAADRRIPYALIQENEVMRVLKEHDYDVVHFDSGWLGTEWTPLADEVVHCGRASEFERVVVKTTVLAAFGDEFLRDDTRERVLCQFEALAGVPAARADAESPAFVFAHFLTPHAPYVFDGNGAPVNGEAVLAEAADPQAARADLYVDQVAFVESRMAEVVDTIRSEDPDAVIILQSDHGAAMPGDWHDEGDAFKKVRMRNLNAFHLPGVPEDEIPDEMTNVNTFRLVFNHYLGTDLPLLDDRVHYSVPSRPYAWEDVTEATAFDD